MRNLKLILSISLIFCPLFLLFSKDNNIEFGKKVVKVLQYYQNHNKSENLIKDILYNHDKKYFNLIYSKIRNKLLKNSIVNAELELIDTNFYNIVKNDIKIYSFRYSYKKKNVIISDIDAFDSHPNAYYILFDNNDKYYILLLNYNLNHLMDYKIFDTVANNDEFFKKSPILLKDRLNIYFYLRKIEMISQILSISNTDSTIILKKLLGSDTLRFLIGKNSDNSYYYIRKKD